MYKRKQHPVLQGAAMENIAMIFHEKGGKLYA
jgi:hypothetical protein